MSLSETLKTLPNKPDRAALLLGKFEEWKADIDIDKRLRVINVIKVDDVVLPISGEEEVDILIQKNQEYLAKCLH